MIGREEPEDIMNLEESRRMMHGEDEPDDLICPIAHLMFRDPVFLADGETYERSDAFLQHIRSTQRSPLHGTDLPNTDFITNWDKRRAVARWLADNPNVTPTGWPDRHVPPPSNSPPSRSSWGTSGIEIDGIVWLTCFVDREVLVDLARRWIWRTGPYTAEVQHACARWNWRVAVSFGVLLIFLINYLSLITPEERVKFITR